MTVKTQVRTGGLMRCCLASLTEAMAAATEAPKDGDTLPCRYHDEPDPVMIFRDGAWEWVGARDI